jgi:hypothetical protein
MKLHCKPGFDNHSIMTGDWYDEHEERIFHERVYWPKHFLNHTRQVHYWLCHYPYTDLKLANKDAKKFGFVSQQGFYCEAPNLHWFPIFNDFEKVLVYLKHKTGITYEAE